MKNCLLFSLVLLMLTSCEKTVDFKINDVPPKLVVEATIENGEPPKVILTKSASYFAALTPQLLESSFVHGAEITISNGTLTHRLKEYAVPIIGSFAYYYYSIDSSNLSTSFVGQLNTVYSMTIVSEGQTYTAKTTIPGYNKQIDSLFWRPGNDTTNRKVQVVVKATDPPGFGNYVRYWTKRNREQFLPGFNSVFDDYVIDGTTYELPVEPGVDRNSTSNDYESRSFKHGDTVTFKLSGIDHATYDFWSTMEYTYTTIGNPFGSPVRVKSNISNNALGYFGGYASQYHTLIIPQ